MYLINFQSKNFITKFVGFLFLLFLIFLPFIMKAPYIKHVFIMVFIYAIVAESWNILSGYTGQFSLGNAMFFGLGAYTSSILLIKYNINPWIGMIIGGLIAATFGIIIGSPVFRLRSHYFVIATLAINEIVMVIFLNWEYVNGARGLDLPLLPDSFKNMTFLYNKDGFYFISLAFLLFVTYIIYKIITSKIGYYFKTIKGEEDAASSIGINTVRYKLVAISITAFFTAAAGTIYAQYMLYIDPAMVLSSMLSIKIVLIAALGGVSTLFGPIIGAFILIPIIEFTRVFFGGAGQGFDLLIYGILVMLIALFRPFGLITLFKPGKNSQ